MATQIELPYLVKDRDRHGNIRWYVKKRGHKKIRMHVEPDAPEFLQAYAAARESMANGIELESRNRIVRASTTPGTIAYVAARYFGSPEFNSDKLTDKSRSIRRASIEECLREKVKNGTESGMIPAKSVSAAHINWWVEKKKAFPGAAENRKKFISAMCTWAVSQDPPLMLFNPCRSAKSARVKTEGFHAWTEQELQQFEAKHPIGSKARLAFALMLYLGIRISDSIRIGRQHMVKGGEPALRFVVYKTRKHRPTPSTKPVLPELAEVIAASPCGDLNFLVTDKGTPFSDAYASQKMREWCDEAGLPHCSAHGLRKAAACRAVLAGATGPDLMAIFDWSSLEQAQRYIEQVKREGMAAKAMSLLRKAV
jgi:integrase